MPKSADFHVETSDTGAVAVLTGDWTAVGMGRASERLADALAAEPTATVDLTQVGRCDTSGVYGVLRAIRETDGHEKIVASPEVEKPGAKMKLATSESSTSARRSGGSSPTSTARFLMRSASSPLPSSR